MLCVFCCFVIGFFFVEGGRTEFALSDALYQYKWDGLYSDVVRSETH